MSIKLTEQNFDAEVGHAHFVQVRVAQGEPDRHGGFVLDRAVDFPAGIAARFLHLHPYVLKRADHALPSIVFIF